MPDAPPATDVLRASGLLTLGDDPPPEAVEAALRQLGASVNGSDALARATLREGAIRELKAAGIGSPARMVDAALSAEEDGEGEDGSGGPGTRLALSDPEPWPDPVDGSALLEELVRTFARFVALPDGAATALALWTLHAHAHAYAAVSPLLALTSPEKRCGKTTLLTLLGTLVPRPLPASNITPAALFRAVESFRPTLLVDEADTFLREREELRGILNSGHTRAGAVIVRAVVSGDDHEARIFSTWAPKAVALIDSGTTLPDTLRDRSIEVRMRRRGPREHVERLRLDRMGDMEPTRRRVARWTADHAEDLRHSDPDVPSELHDRARDNWRPLLALADAAGGDWPARARRASVALSTDREDDEASAAVLLLGDLRTLFRDQGVDRLPSQEIVDALEKMEDRPWPEWRRGNPLSTRQLARLLRPFDVSPKKLRIGDSTPRGYLAEDFEEAWTRYLSTPTPPGDPEQAEQARNDATFGGSEIRNTEGDVPDREGAENPLTVRDVPGVPDGAPPLSGEVGVPDLLDDLGDD